MTKRRTIGIIGGMGPAATVEFFRRLVVATPARRDQDHLHILVDNDPAIPNRTAALLAGGEDPTPRLVASARRLEAAGAEVLAMPCNTAHAFLPAISEAVRIPVVDMIEETAKRLSVGPVGLLATSGTIRIGLYERVFALHGLDLLVPEPEDQASVEDAIHRIKAGDPATDVMDAVRDIVDAIAEQGAAEVVAGCTELSLIDGADMPLPWIDALDVLVEATLREATI